MHNIIRLSAAALLSASILPASAAPVYECMQNGKRVYTQNPGSHCQKADVGRVGLYSSTPPANNPQPAAQESRAENHAAGSDTIQRQAARQQLEQAQKALEDGKKVRYGNERNYVRYQERIRNLEAAVGEAQQKLDALDKTDDSGGAAISR
ncbi:MULTISPECIES: lipoic acid synthetase [unclassified Neisseria]|uniref:lipoic acid synthetase n=1 Tax=unclassified Neisseria TaxID=2623750 RepID=UPI0010722071|nr:MULTISPECIES: lipoic acid synthetase [unclassified Neisseria]MBF0802948.1 lipoic acid synthetase [Neisseria sp. 19428wB4_WF04]TFU44477.1 lipoic acid synthetase [Neisseria sp. WF04]